MRCESPTILDPAGQAVFNESAAGQKAGPAHALNCFLLLLLPADGAARAAWAPAPALPVAPLPLRVCRPEGGACVS